MLSHDVISAGSGRESKLDRVQRQRVRPRRAESGFPAAIVRILSFMVIC